MTREEAYFRKLLLLTGYDDPERKWLMQLLEAEPLEDVALELAWAGDDPKALFSCLNAYAPQKAVDSAQVFDLAWRELRNRFRAGEMDAPQCMRAMAALAQASGFSLEEPWQTAGLFYDNYQEALAGYFSMEQVTDGFRRFMEDGARPENPWFSAEPAQPKARKSLRAHLRRILHRD